MIVGRSLPTPDLKSNESAGVRLVGLGLVKKYIWNALFTFVVRSESFYLKKYLNQGLNYLRSIIDN